MATGEAGSVQVRAISRRFGEQRLRACQLRQRARRALGGARIALVNGPQVLRGVKSVGWRCALHAPVRGAHVSSRPCVPKLTVHACAARARRRATWSRDDAAPNRPSCTTRHLSQPIGLLTALACNLNTAKHFTGYRGAARELLDLPFAANSKGRARERAGAASVRDAALTARALHFRARSARALLQLSADH